MAAALATDADLLAEPFLMTAVAVGTRAWGIAMAATKISVTELGDKASFAHALLAAHYITHAAASGAGGSGGVVSAKTIGSLSVSYAVTASADAELGSTRWGVMYQQLAETAGMIGVVGRRCPPSYGGGVIGGW